MHGADVLDNRAALKRNGQVDVGAAPHEALRHHADYGAHRVVQPQPAPEHIGIAAELALPEAVAEHDHRFGAGAPVVAAHRPADECRDPHYLEGIERAVISAQAPWLSITGPDHVADRGGNDAFEDAVAPGDLHEL